MSWHWLVTRKSSACRARDRRPGHRPAMAPVVGSAKMRGRLTMRAFSGAASGTWMTSMLKSEVFGSSFGSRPSSRPARRPTAPCSCPIRRCRCCPDPSGRRPACACAIRGRSAPPRSASACLMSLMSKMRTPRKRSALTVSVDALRAAVDPSARLLDRHEQQVPVDRDVALSAGTHDRGEQLRLLRRLDVVDVEAVEVADEDERCR